MDLDKIIREHRKDNPRMIDLFAEDTNQDMRENWDKAKLKVLIVFLGDAPTKAYSSTYTCIHRLMKSVIDVETDMFIDGCYFPVPEVGKRLRELNLPYMIGNCSHHSWHDYDVVSISHSISPECCNAFNYYYHSDFPFTHEERMADSEAPLVLYGGAASTSIFPVLSGEIPGRGHSLFDIGMFGYGEEVLPRLFKELLEFNLNKSLKANKQEFIDHLLEDSYFTKHYFFPFLYKIHYKSDNVSIDHFEHLDSRIPDKVACNVIHEPIFKGFSKKFFNADGLGAHSVDVQISSGCSSFCCAFCAEGNEAGHWTEKPLEQIEQEIVETKMYSAASNITPFSFNMNYYSNYYDMLATFIRHGASISILNNRADVVGSDNIYMKLARKLGLIRTSMPIEGCGDRIRNKIMNKNLPRNVLIQAARNAFEQKLIAVKFGMILTGLETDEDLADFLDEVDEILRVRDEVGSSTSISMTFTPFVYYNQIPMRWYPRVMSRRSLYNEKTLYQMVPELMRRGIRTKFHGGGISVWAEQLLLDIGWRGTEFLYKLIGETDFSYSSTFPMILKEPIMRLLEDMKIPFDFNFNGYDVDDVFAIDCVAFTTEYKFNMWKEMYRRQDFSHPICLVTPANPQAKCYNCGCCDTVDEKKKVFKRSLTNKTSFKEINTILSENRPRMYVRVSCQMANGCEIYSKEMLEHIVTSKFLQADKRLLDAFYKVESHNFSWILDFGQSQWSGGYFTYDLSLNRRVDLSLFTDVIDTVNSNLRTCRVIKVVETSSDNLLNAKGSAMLNSFITKINFMSFHDFQDKLMLWDRVNLVARKCMTSYKVEPMPFGDFYDYLILKNIGGYPVLHSILPKSWNPDYLVSAISGKSVTLVRSQTSTSLVDAFRDTLQPCKCGSYRGYSYIHDKILNACPMCNARNILDRMK